MIESTETGLTDVEALARLRTYGPNVLPEASEPSILVIFLRQFLSPLIYILVAAAVVAAAMSDFKDAAFIAVVLVLNGAIGTFQEYTAGRAVSALRRLEQPQATVMRSGVVQTIDARTLVPGDLVFLESGVRVPADLRLIFAQSLRCDESLLTGESMPVAKQVSGAGVGDDKDRAGLVFAGSSIVRGRGQAVVTATGARSQLGRIAESVGRRSMSRPPLLIRLERFSRNIAIAVAVAICVLAVFSLLRDMAFRDLFFMSVALAVSAIPEGLPVAISVALAVSMRRMARVGVIVRKMPAIESLGSCTMIATDKTGTLTMNELTVTEVRLPEGSSVHFEVGRDLAACAVHSPQMEDEEARVRAAGLLRAAALPNEGTLLLDGDGWKGVGDTVDVALLQAALKAGLRHDEIAARHPLLARIPYEPEQRYAASFHDDAQGVRIFVKGAPEQLIAMSDRMDDGGAAAPIDRAALFAQQAEMAARGLRVLAFAEGRVEDEPGGYGRRHLVNLVFLGLAGMQDPLRPEVPEAVRACRAAGVEVAIVTGDDPRTARAIARQAGLEYADGQIAGGDEVAAAQAEGETTLDALTRRARIFARVEPAQKLAIVLSLARNGHFVAVTGDGVNDAPALKHAHVGVAMGRNGTDVARESSDIVLSDDNFASIVRGIREGRVAYANIRKVIFMVVSTGAAEVVLFLLAIALGLPMPLLPVQLLWLNLITNGIQDVALAAERAEGDELAYPPRRPDEPIFDRVMLRRILHSTATMGIVGFAVFWWLIDNGYGEFEARNMLFVLIVLFENFQTFNSRSERHSVFRQSFRSNPLLIVGVLAALGLQIAAMYVPLLADTLSLAPLSLAEWAVLVLAASSVLLVMELEKLWDGGRRAA